MLGGDGTASPTRRRVLAGLVAALLLAWGAAVELFLLLLCVLDDTGNPHECPEAVWPLVVTGLAAVAVAAGAAWISLGRRPMEVAAAVLTGAALIAALAFGLDGAAG